MDPTTERGVYQRRMRRWCYNGSNEDEPHSESLDKSERASCLEYSLAMIWMKSQKQLSYLSMLSLSPLAYPCKGCYRLKIESWLAEIAIIARGENYCIGVFPFHMKLRYYKTTLPTKICNMAHSDVLPSCFGKSEKWNVRFIQSFLAGEIELCLPVIGTSRDIYWCCCYDLHYVEVEGI